MFADGSFEFITPGVGSRHQFTSGGMINAEYFTTDNDGGVSSLAKTINVKINNLPIASFECSSTGPQKLNCYSTSTDPDQGDSVVSFDWAFGDGATQSGLAGNFDHTYGVNPLYTVKLTARDQFGGSST